MTYNRTQIVLERYGLRLVLESFVAIKLVTRLACRASVTTWLLTMLRIRVTSTRDDTSPVTETEQTQQSLHMPAQESIGQTRWPDMGNCNSDDAQANGHLG